MFRPSETRGAPLGNAREAVRESPQRISDQQRTPRRGCPARTGAQPDAAI